MAYLLTQAGTTLYKVDLSTGVATALTLPTGITLDATRKPKFALLNQWVAMVNSPSRNLVIDPEGTVVPMVPLPPTRYPRIQTGSGTGLTGAYMYAVSYIVKNADGDLLFESPIGPPSAAFTPANQDLALTIIPQSEDAYVTGRRFYRTLVGGAATVMFHIFDLDDNTTQAINDNTPDATVTLLPSLVATLISPPGTMPGSRFKNIVSWKSRFWAIPEDPALNDIIYATETNIIYMWPNQLVAYPTGQSEKGVIGFVPRKNSLGFLKTTGVWAVGGVANSTGVNISKISLQQLDDGKKGGSGEDTILVIGDAAYWLGRNGVYEWTDNGIESITDDLVKPWFQTDTYFNRTRFEFAFARYNEVTNTYELHLAAAGSSTENRWVGFNLTTRKWYGPHKTGAFTPTHAWHQVDGDNLPMTIVGASDGVIYTGNSANKRDGAATAIDMDCYGPFHTGDNPDLTHTWLQLSAMTRVEAAGTMTITPEIGVAPLNVVVQPSITHTLTTGRELLSRIGSAAICRLRFRKNTVNQSATIYGYDLPWFTNGRR